MRNYIVNGGRRLIGEIDISGSKNASLPILAASILNGKTTKLYNVPNISDVKTTIEILEYMGCKVKKDKSKIQINSREMTEKQIPDELMRKLRSSVILAGAILSRFGVVEFSYPGGCDIGSRPIDLHLKSLKKLGVKIEEKSGYITCKCDKIIGNEIVLDFPSVGATENIILASVFAEGKVIIKNAAMEPEIVDLANMLNKMGANITGAGSNIVRIIGVKKLKEVSYTIMPDRIEAGTFLLATAITRGKIKLNKVIPEHLNSIIYKLEETGAKFENTKNTIYMEVPNKLHSVEIKTMPYPGFPTDLQQLFSTFLTTVKGTSVITETIFENRFKYIQELKRMGAKVNQEGNTIIIKGVRKLHGTTLECTDLRGGASIVIAALSAKGISRISKIEYIDRGYSDFYLKLNQLGAEIKLEVGD